MNQNLQELMQSPLFKRAQEMASGKTESELQQVAMNLCNSKGINYNEAIAQFNKMFYGK